MAGDGRPRPRNATRGLIKRRETEEDAELVAARTTTGGVCPVVVVGAPKWRYRAANGPGMESYIAALQSFTDDSVK